MEVSFKWEREETWPFDGPDHIFLARAVSQIGASLYGEEWRGDEMYVDTPYPLSKTHHEATAREHARAIKLLEVHRPDESVELRVGADGAKTYEFTPSQWIAAQDAWQEEKAGILAGRRRFAAVKLAIREHCAWARLSAAVRDISGGDFRAIEAEKWNTERFGEWFSKCQIPSSAAFGGWGNSDHRRYWLFIERASLTRICGNVATVGPSQNESSIYFSPYMRLMLEAIRRQNLTREDQSTVESIKSTLREVAREMNIDLSERLEKAMPTIMREPESKNGRNRKGFTQ